jgi:hypothetical protein
VKMVMAMRAAKARQGRASSDSEPDGPGEADEARAAGF